MASLAPDLNRVKTRGGFAKVDVLTRRIFVTPWDCLSVFIPTISPPGSTVNHSFLIPVAPRRFKVSIGAIFGSVQQPTGIGTDAETKIYILDKRKSIPSGTTWVLDTDNVIALWHDGQVSQSFFPDGLLLPRDVVPIVLFVHTGETEGFGSVWYRYEEWS